MTAEEAVAYLLRENLLDLGKVVGCGLEVRDVTRRNINFHVACRTGPGFFLKRQSPGDSSPTMLAEAGIYQRVMQDERLARLRQLIPGFHRYDPNLNLLVLDLCRGHSVAQALVSERLPPIGRQLGAALAACHGSIRLTDRDEGGEGLFQVSPPAFEIATPGPSLFREAGPIQIDIVRQIQARPEVQAALEGLPELWSPECLIHGDIRWDNVLIEAGSEGGAQPGIRILDWESAGIGDPAWDVGCVLFAYLAACLAHRPDSAEDPDAVRQSFSTHLDETQGDIQAFWDSYAVEAGLNGPGRALLLDRAALFGGVRLIQHAFELTQGVAQMPADVVFALQLAFNILTRSRDVPSELLGIGTDSYSR